MSPEPQSEFTQRPNSNGEPQPDSMVSSHHLADILERAVDATFDESSTDCDLSPALRAVATKFSASELSVDPVMTELVDVVTRRYKVLSATQRATLNSAVAQTLFDDTSTRMRLDKLWRRLRIGD